MQIRVTTLMGLLFTVLSSLLMSACGGSGGADVPSGKSESVTYVKGVVNMSAGFQVSGPHGVAQIDGNTVVLALTGRGQITMPAGGMSGQGAESIHDITPQITVTGITPMLCIRSTEKAIALGVVARAGSTFSYTLIGRSTPAPAIVDWYVFDSPSLLPASKSGIQVFNEQGQMVFDAQQAPMRVVNVGMIPAGSPINAPARLDAPYPGVYAACLSQGRIASVWGGSSTNVFEDGIIVDDNGFRTQAVSMYLLPGNTPIASTDAAMGILVDVAGL